MNVAFFLTPKSAVIWLPTNGTMRYAIERMESSGYAALPLLDAHGRYVGTITEGDLLRKLAHTEGMSFADTSQVRLDEVPVRRVIHAVGIDAEVEELFNRAVEQNFVPVVDSREAFIGIVRRREILEYCAGALRRRDGLDEGSGMT
jgi:CBS domain-containing protein